VRIIGDEYQDKNFGRSYCKEKGIALHFNTEIIVFRAVVRKDVAEKKIQEGASSKVN
jgi:hypothetical protein